jgi:uncharacterized RDD family membrane protein YckC
VLLFGTVLASSWALSAGVLPAETAAIINIAAVVLVWVVIPTAVETASRGRSLGKLAVGARIVRADGGASGFRQAFIRALLGVFELWMTLGAVAAIVGAFAPRSQRLGDLLAGTYAERTRTPPLPPTDLAVPSGLEAWAELADVARLPDRLARRVAQFMASAPRLVPAARTRAAASLAGEVAEFVSPLPAVPPETLLAGVIAVRRARELRALEGQAVRVARLTAGTDGVRPGFPDR